MVDTWLGLPNYWFTVYFWATMLIGIVLGLVLFRKGDTWERKDLERRYNPNVHYLRLRKRKRNYEKKKAS